MNTQPTPYKYWRATVFAGALLIAVGSASYLDFTTHFNFEFISDHFDIFASITLGGILVSFIGCIGWAKHLGRRGRARMAGLVFISPLPVLLISYLVDGINAHGTAAFVFLSILVATILTVVLLVMAALAAR